MVVALIPVLLLGSAILFSSKKALTQQASDQLEAIRQVKSQQLKTYFSNVQDQVVTFSENPMVQEATVGFRQALATLDAETELSEENIGDLREELKSIYGQNDVVEGKSVDELIGQLDDKAVYLQSYYYQNATDDEAAKTDNSSYGDHHKKYHSVIPEFANRFDYENVLLFDAKTGRLIYAVDKNVDFITSLTNGSSAKSSLGRIVQKTAEIKQDDAVTFGDFSTYTPSSTVAAFVASPVIVDGVTSAVAVLQLPIDAINTIMNDHTGLGETGENYVVGFDRRFRNDSRFVKTLGVDSTVLNSDVKVNTSATKAAFDGESGTQIIEGFQGTRVLSSWAPITVLAGNQASGIKPVTWAAVTEMQLSEVQSPLKTIGANAIWFGLGGGVIVLLLPFVVARSFLKQTNAITNMLQNIGMGDLDARAEVLSNDELGRVAEALNAMCDNTLSLIQSKDERDRIEEAVKQLKSEVAAIASGDLTVEAEVEDSLTGAIADSVNDMVAQLRGIVRNVQEATYHVSSSANEIHSRTQEVSIDSEAQSTQILDTSGAIESMANSVHSISANTSQSAAVAQTARDRAAKGATAVQDTIDGMTRIRDQVQDSSKRIKRLGETSQEVGEIVQLIGDIADRTSILALNASIQAAMAGEAGQGFAVVAEEVERLAEHSNDATKQIETLIKAIQNDTAEAISAMEASTKEVVEGSKLASICDRR
ncbi:MAG: hypothetical protein CMJ78_15670 [Planctomycetaceae bacterium]|nr:hypothetical protein [Planctomycetaceae bacterium]